MSVGKDHIIYRGFTPKPIHVNYEVKKPSVLYRGFVVNQPVLTPNTLFCKPKLVYRGVAFGKPKQDVEVKSIAKRFAMGI